MAPGSATVYCRDCGTEISATAEYCPDCGTRQTNASTPLNEGHDRQAEAIAEGLLQARVKKFWVGLVGFLLIFLIGMFALLVGLVWGVVAGFLSFIIIIISILVSAVLAHRSK